MNYEQFLQSKQKNHVVSGFEIDESQLNKNLFPFQKFIVKRALHYGKYAIFADCGLGKTLMQLEWAQRVKEYTNKKVLILAPLVVVEQTKREALKFGIDIDAFDADNYEQLDNIDSSQYSGIVLDESSILKNFEGATKQLILEKFANTPYKLACTATPSPNDPMELGNHSEFLDVMSRNQMLAMYFVHDGGETAKWRLKGHAIKSFYQFIGTWAIMLNKPQDIGFQMDGYALPKLNLFEEKIITGQRDNGQLFNDVAISATNFNSELRATQKERLSLTARIAREKSANGEDVIIWIKQNAEGEELKKLIPNSKEITGNISNELKKALSLWFTNNECLCQFQNKEKNTIKNGIQKIKTELKNTIKNIAQEEEIGQTINIKTMPNLGSEPKGKLKKHIKNTPIQDLEILSENYTESQSKNTENCSKSKAINVQSARENLPSLQQSKDCTLTIATQQEKSEDYFASTAITQSENSKIISECSSGQSCICGANKKGKILISKTKIMGMGINMQNCYNQIFPSLDFSFEGLYQSMRRSYRFGQKNEVNIYLISTDTMSNVIQSISNKQKQFEIMQHEMEEAVNVNLKNENLSTGEFNTESESNEWYQIKRGDSCQLIKEVESESVGLSVFSPPFAELYTYSSHVEDMGNSKDYNEFLTQFGFLINELYRIMIPGRNVAVHCMDLPIQKGKEGFIGLRDFSGMILKAFEEAGFIYASRVTIWKDPVVEMQRTKALGLLHKQVKKDSTMSRVGIPDYVMIFRKDGERTQPVTNTNIPVDLWQKIASPVWMDIDYGNTLQGHRNGRDEKDEKHICPLQLDTIERLILLYSNKGDTVFTPFMGIGSEVYQAVKMERKAIGFELKESYFELAKKNVASAVESKAQLSLL